MTGFHLASLWNWRSLALGRIVEPLCYVLFLLAGLRNALSALVPDYPLFVLTGMICMLSFRSGIAALGDVANDRKWGVLAFYRLSNGRVWGYVLSIILYSVTFQLVQCGVVVAVLLLVFPGGLNPVEIAVAVGLGLLCGAAWAGAGAAIAGAVDSYPRRDMIITLTALPVVMSAPLFFPRGGAPDYLAAIMRINPLSYEAEALRAPTVLTLPAVAAITLVMLIVATTALRLRPPLSTER